MWFSGHGGTWSKVGLDDLGGVSYDTMTLISWIDWWI